MFNLFRKSRDNIISPEMKWSLENAAPFTPDIWKLEQYQFQLLFVYCGLMQDHKENSLLNEASAFYCKAFTDDDFSMWKKKLGMETFPIALQDKYTCVPSCKIKGEVYAVRPYHFIELDKHKKNGVEFLRKRIKVQVPYRQVGYRHGDMILSEEKVHIIKAWIYLGVPDYWSSILDAGYSTAPVRTFEPKNKRFKEYYYFSQLEFNDKNSSG